MRPEASHNPPPKARKPLESRCILIAAVTLPQLDARLLGRRPPPQAHRADLINTAVDCVCGILQSVGQSGTGIGYVQKAWNSTQDAPPQGNTAGIGTSEREKVGRVGM